MIIITLIVLLTCVDSMQNIEGILAPRNFRKKNRAAECESAGCVRGCVEMSALVGQIEARDVFSQQFDNFERQLRFSGFPTEIESRVRCKGLNWGSERGRRGGLSPYGTSCLADQRYFVGSKRTMLAAMLSMRPKSFFDNARVLIIGLGGGSQVSFTFIRGVYVYIK